MERDSPRNERRLDPRRPTRRQPSLGRRRTDYDMRTTVTAKAIAAIAFIVNALYLAGEILVYGHNCP